MEKVNQEEERAGEVYDQIVLAIKSNQMCA